MMGFPKRLPKREHRKCEGHEGCMYWAYSRARRSPTADWHWYCPACLNLVQKCGWEVDSPAPRTDGEKHQGDHT